MNVIKNIQELLSKGHIKEALDLLIDITENCSPKIKKRLMLILTEYNSVNQSQTENIIKNQKLNDLKKSILELSFKIEKELTSENVAKQKEIERLLTAHSKMIERIKVLITINKKTILRYLTLSVIIVLVGVTVIVLANSDFLADNTLKNILTISGGLVSSISGFPIKIINEKYNAISLWKEFMKSLKRINQNEEIITHKEEIEKIKLLIWEKSEKLLLT